MEDNHMRIKLLAVWIATIMLMTVFVMVSTPLTMKVSATTITVPDDYGSIQDAVDAASSGDTVIVKDRVGDYHQSVVFGSEDSGITLKSTDGATLDGDGPADSGTTLSAHGISLSAGVSDVTIEGLEIRDYTSTSRSSGIEAWNDGTSDITISNNKIKENLWNGILVGNEGTGLHESWVINDNEVFENGFVGIELTNGHESIIKGNTAIENGWANLVLQARNTIANSGLFISSDILVTENNLLFADGYYGGAGYGIYALSFAGSTDFNPIPGATALLTGLNIKNNDVKNNINSGMILWKYLDGIFANNNIHRNEVNYNEGNGIYLIDGDDITIHHNEVNNNDFDGISIRGSDTTNIHHNKLNNNDRYGISIRNYLDGSNDNVIHHNVVKNSDTFDLYESTSGTGNLWHHNVFDSSDPDPIE
jgi:parallel beta-helix repeat protein